MKNVSSLCGIAANFGSVYPNSGIFYGIPIGFYSKSYTKKVFGSLLSKFAFINNPNMYYNFEYPVFIYVNPLSDSYYDFYCFDRFHIYDHPNYLSTISIPSFFSSKDDYCYFSSGNFVVRDFYFETIVASGTGSLLDSPLVDTNNMFSITVAKLIDPNLEKITGSNVIHQDFLFPAYLSGNRVYSDFSIKLEESDIIVLNFSFDKFTFPYGYIIFRFGFYIENF